MFIYWLLVLGVRLPFSAAWVYVIVLSLLSDRGLLDKRCTVVTCTCHEDVCCKLWTTGTGGLLNLVRYFLYMICTDDLLFLA